MEFRSVKKWERISPVKARLVADNVRGMGVQDALEMLMFMPQKAAKVIYKTVASALANAEHTGSGEKPDVDHLYVKTLTVDTGPTLKRISRRAYGRAHRKRRRMSHVTVVLTARVLTDEETAEELEKKKEHRTPFFRRKKRVGEETEAAAGEPKPGHPKQPKRPRQKGGKRLAEERRGKYKSVQKRPEG